ncbi:MAG: hypothetical protein AVDCRST_MAG88-4544, partial [uncultured Thermomicrobiales bacterium]
ECRSGLPAGDRPDGDCRGAVLHADAGARGQARSLVARPARWRVQGRARAARRRAHRLRGRHGRGDHARLAPARPGGLPLLDRRDLPPGPAPPDRARRCDERRGTSDEQV